MTPSADTAILTLEKIKASCGASCLAYWVLPNTILTLSGARALCDGVYWSDDQTLLDQWNEEIARSLDVLKKHRDVAVAFSGVQSVRDNEQCASLKSY